MKKSIFLVVTNVLLISANVAAQESLLEEVVVSVNKYQQKSFDAAASVNVLNKEIIQEKNPGFVISESMNQVPGLYVLNRQNYAQDALISSRSFGSNSAFGARGIKIYVDGIPATIADGQGQTSHIDLSSAEKIEVLRGPFASIYGNSAGGVIQVTTEKGQPGNRIDPYLSFGSFSTKKIGIKATGDDGLVNYSIDTNRFDTHGYRLNSAASKDVNNVKLVFPGSDTGSYTALVANHINLYAFDPLGLNASQLQQNPLQAGTNASLYKARKYVTQTQGGIEFVKKINPDESIKISSYYGRRDQNAFQAQATNGALVLNRDFYGIDAQLVKVANLLGMPSKMVIGTTYDLNNDMSNSYTNTLGVQTGSLGTSAGYQAYNFDQYAQIETYLSEKFVINGGLRHANITLAAKNNLATGGWTEGGRAYSAVLPMASLSFIPGPLSNIYISAGKGLDTPTLNQVKYSCLTAASCTVNGSVWTISQVPNMLNASDTIQYELGWKQKIPGYGNFSIAVFEADSRNEIVVNKNYSGKVVYTNANKTLRRGVELFGDFVVTKNIGLTTSYTYVLAKIANDYTTLSWSGSSINNIPTISTIAAGSYIPGAPRQKFYGDIYWKSVDKKFESALEVSGASGIVVDDINSTKSNGYAIYSARLLIKQTPGSWEINEFLRVNNIFDKTYVGSVIVNQKDLQFYEPSPGRNWVVGIKAKYKFN